MRRKNNIIGGFGGFSDMKSVIVIDNTPPGYPPFLLATPDYNQMTLEWTANTDPDFEAYIIYRSTNNIDFVEIKRLSEDTYIDTGLTQNTNYYYKIGAIDVSGNASSLPPSLFVKTLKDLRQPLPISGLLGFARDSAVQLLWTLSQPGNTDHYEIVTQPLDREFLPTGTATRKTVSANKNFAVITDLLNGQNYKFTVYAVSVNDVFSAGVSTSVQPLFNQGPGEVEDIDITYSEGDNDDSNVIMQVCLTPSSDPYEVTADRYIITLIENGTRVSNQIVIPRGDFCREIRLIPFTENGEIVYSSVKERTPYIVKVTAVSAEGISNNGTIAETVAPTFVKPPPVSNVVVTQRQDFTILASWINSSSPILSFNRLTVKRRDLETSIETTLLNAQNIGVASTYVLAASEAKANSLLTFVIQAVDTFGNVSPAVTSLFTIAPQSEQTPPQTPTGQSASAGDKQVKLQWNPLDPNEIKAYNIYRAVFSFFPTADSFSKIDTVPNNVSSYIDFSVTNGQTYMYLVSAVNIYDLESENPTNQEEFFSIGLLNATPTASATLSNPLNLVVIQSGFDAVLTWDAGAGAFDGYEVWRSVGNKYSFEPIGSVPPGTLTYTDTEVLIKAGISYYYMVRKFRNEAEPFLSESNTAPQGSTIIAKITTSGGSVTIDETVATELKNLEDIVRAEAKRQLALHKHNIDELGNDKRISLLSDIRIEDWTTNDFKTYTTTQDIGGATAYIVNLKGNVNEAFFKDDAGNTNTAALELLRRGVPPFLFDVNGGDGQIIFEFPLAPSFEGEVTPFTEPPVLTVTLTGVSEVSNTLPNDRIGDFSAVQVGTGIIDPLQLPKINHDGRIDEPLIPTQHEMQSDDKFTFTFKDTATKLGDTLTFYDVFQVDEDVLLAATSRGILKTENFGSSWSEVEQFPTSPHKLFYSSILNRYFALTNQGVYASRGNLGDWTLMSGTENAKTIRDIVADGSGNVFISTDLGVYRLDVATVNQFFSWEQTSLFGPRSTESYALLYDAPRNRLIVSNELGILQSTNGGRAWTFSTEFDEFKRIFAFVPSGNAIFALTNDAIYRRTTGNFELIAELDGKLARRMVIYNDRLWVTTDEGVFVSKPEDNILISTSLTMRRTLPELNVNNNVVPATGLNVIEDRLFVGTDQRLFIRQNNKVWLQYEDSQGAVPSVFVDGVLQKIGVRYNPKENNVSFDEKQKVSALVSTSVAYNEYHAQFGGWVIQKFDSRVKIHVNDAIIADSNDLATGITVDVKQLTDYQFPTYDETNSYSAGADKYKAEAQAKITRLEGILSTEELPEGEERPKLDEGETLADAISSLYTSIEKFLSQLFEEARVITVESGTTTESIPVDYPPILVKLATGVEYDVSDGKVTFTSPYTKYDRLSVDVLGVTVKNVGEFSHKEVEDELELINSGLPSSLSQVQQVNVTKLGIFNQRHWPGEQKKLATPYQAVYNVPFDSSWYDVLNSTVDWQVIDENDSVSPTLPYASTAAYLPLSGKVLVGGPTGAFSIDVETFDIDFVRIDGDGSVEVKQFYVKGDTVYALTATDIYTSENEGVVWTRLDRIGLPNRLYSIAFIRDALIVGAEDGIYYRISEADGWVKAIAATEPVEILYDPEVVFALVGNTVYFSNDGVNWVASGSRQTVQINALKKFKSIIFAASDEGLYKDDGTFYGSGATLSLVDILDNTIESKKLVVNDIDTDANRLLVGLSDGRLAVLEANAWFVIDETLLKAVHKVLVIGEQIWLFGYDLFTVFTGEGSSFGSMTAYPMKLTTGVPL
jgi:hypothetical protein